MNLASLAQRLGQIKEVQLLPRRFDGEEERAELIACIAGEEEKTQLIFLCDAPMEEEESEVFKPFRNNRQRLRNIRPRQVGMLEGVQKVWLGDHSAAVTEQEESRLELEQIGLLVELLHRGWSPWMTREAEGMRLVTLTLEESWQEIQPVLRGLQDDPTLPVELDIQPLFQLQPVSKRLTLTIGEEKGRRFDVMIRGENLPFWLERVYQYDPWEQLASVCTTLGIGQNQPQCQAMRAQLESICPSGQLLTVVEYENEQNIQLEFYDEEYLRQKKSDSSTSMGLRLNRTTGRHGFPLRAAVLQTPHPSQVQRCRVEILTAYLPPVPKRVQFIG